MIIFFANLILKIEYIDIAISAGLYIFFRISFFFGPTELRSYTVSKKRIAFLFVRVVGEISVKKNQLKKRNIGETKYTN